jgi:hypothetical protein
MLAKKLLPLVSLVLVATAGMMPAQAQAEWTHDHAPLEEFASPRLFGEVRFSVPFVGSIGCKTEWSLLIFPGGGEVEELYPTSTKSCSGTGALSGCEVENHETASLWSIDENTATDNLTVTNATIFTTFVPGSCLFGTETSHLQFSDLTLTPFGSSSTMTSLELSGTDWTVGAEASGLLTVFPSGTYGVA